MITRIVTTTSNTSHFITLGVAGSQPDMETMISMEGSDGGTRATPSTEASVASRPSRPLITRNGFLGDSN